MKNYNKVTLNLTPFVDYLFNILLIFVLILAFSKVQNNKNQQDATFQQNVIFQIVMEWSKENQSDIDLWAKDSQGHIVGFNRKEGGEGSLMSLAHDDLGAKNNDDKLEFHQEIISIRGITEGEYTVNCHLFHKNEKENGNIKVNCKLVKIKPFKEYKKIEKVLNDNGDEETFFRFSLNKDGDVTDMNDLPDKFVIQSNNSQAEVEQ